jgi:hypothetical protein
MDVVAAIRFVELEIMPTIMLARAGNRGKKGKGRSRNQYCFILQDSLSTAG